MTSEDFIRRAHLHYMVRSYLSSSSLGEVIDVAGVDVAVWSVDIRRDDDRRYRYVATSPTGWRATIEVQADSESYAARIVRLRPDDDAVDAQIALWLRQAATRRRS